MFPYFVSMALLAFVFFKTYDNEVFYQRFELLMYELLEILVICGIVFNFMIMFEGEGVFSDSYIIPVFHLVLSTISLIVNRALKSLLEDDKNLLTLSNIFGFKSILIFIFADRKESYRLYSFNVFLANLACAILHLIF